MSASAAEFTDQILARDEEEARALTERIGRRRQLVSHAMQILGDPEFQHVSETEGTIAEAGRPPKEVLAPFL